MQSEKPIRHFLSLFDLSSDELRQLIARAIELKGLRARNELLLQ